MFTKSSLSFVAALAISSTIQPAYAQYSGDEDSIGACCIDALICETVSQAQCTTFGGLYLGDGTDCLFMVCPDTNTGACCHGDICTQETLENCDLTGGDFLTYSLSCDPNPCVQPVAGACCIGNACMRLSEETCADLGAVFLGELNCDEAACVTDSGICCLADSVCLETSLEDCESAQGTFIQDTTGEGCASNDIPCADGFQCPEGYLPDCNGNCFPVEWLGDGVCDNNELVFGKLIDLGCAEFEFDLGDCVDPSTSGACCLHVGCLTLSHEDCLASGGQFLGTTYLCADSPCGPALQGDFNNNREIDIEDLLATIAGYGQCDPDSPLPCNGDANLDGNVDIEDILLAISKWGFVLPFYIMPEVVLQIDENGQCQVPDFGDPVLGYVQVIPGGSYTIIQNPPAYTPINQVGSLNGSVDLALNGESHHRDVIFQIEDRIPPHIERGFEYSDPGAICHDYVDGIDDIDSEQPVVRVCSGVRLNPTASDNADPNPLLRVYVDGVEVSPGHELEEPGHYIIQYSCEDNSGNTDHRSTFLEVNPIPLMKGEAAVTEYACAFDPVVNGVDFDLTLTVLPPTQEASISDLNLSTATLILTDEYGAPLDLSNGDALRISGSRDASGDYSPATTEASFQDGYWQLRFRSSDLITGEPYLLADCPTYGEFVGTVRLGESDEFDISARFPITAVPVEEYVFHQDGFDHEEEAHGPENENASCACRFKSKWVTKKFPREVSPPRKRRGDSYLDRWAGRTPFNWRDRIYGRESSLRGALKFGSRTPVTTYGVYRVWADGPSELCQSIFEVETDLAAEQRVRLTQTLPGLGPSFVESGGLLSVDSSIGGPGVCGLAAMSRYNYPRGRIDQSLTHNLTRISVSNGGRVRQHRLGVPFQNRPALPRGNPSHSLANSNTTHAGPTVVRRVDVGVSASSLNIAQIMGRNNNSQSVDAGFNQTRFNVLIKGTWQPTECTTEDFERNLDGTEVPAN